MSAVAVAVAVLAAGLLLTTDPAHRLRTLTRPRSRRPPTPNGVAHAPHHRAEDTAPDDHADAGSAAGDGARGDGAPADPALVLDLVATALTAGCPPSTALAVVGAAVRGDTGTALGQVAARLRLGSTWDDAWQHAPEPLVPLRRALTLAVRTGAPPGRLLHDTADTVRDRRHRDAQAAAARLGVRMVLPLGLCALPAFIVWAIVPVVISLAGDLLH